jgi:hypothetical protein
MGWFERLEGPSGNVAFTHAAPIQTAEKGVQGTPCWGLGVPSSYKIPPRMGDQGG